MFCIYSFYSAVGIDRFGDHSNIQRGHKVCVVLLPLFFISNNSHTSFSRSQGHSVPVCYLIGFDNLIGKVMGLAPDHIGQFSPIFITLCVNYIKTTIGKF